ncbi:MAG: ABC transporter permease [Firmicutes bacterium]|nr:ABC transporter permease [Bacillota bacterium]MBR6824622.1 ABC transporter permease [Bacillota bacterium]MBR7113780.1 ABC transporter permease [Bacillota bacterium]
MFTANKKKSILYRLLMMVLSVSSVILLLAAYRAVALANPLLLPSFDQIGERFVKLFTTPIKGVPLTAHVIASLRRVLIAMGFAWVLGILFGFSIGWSRTLNAIFGTIFELFRPIPPIAWIPIVIMWFGVGEFPKELIVFIGSVIPVVVNTRSGVMYVEKQYTDVARAFGASRFQMLKEVVLPSAIPSIFAGLRTSVSTGWTVVLAAEMLAADRGVGALVMRGWMGNDMALVLISISVIAIIGAILSFTLIKLEKVVCPWMH